MCWRKFCFDNGSIQLLILLKKKGKKWHWHIRIRLMCITCAHSTKGKWKIPDIRTGVWVRWQQTVRPRHAAYSFFYYEFMNSLSTFHSENSNEFLLTSSHMIRWCMIPCRSHHRAQKSTYAFYFLCFFSTLRLFSSRWYNNNSHLVNKMKRWSWIWRIYNISSIMRIRKLIAHSHNHP